MQWFAVAIAAAGVIFSIVAYGAVPWAALVLAGCFGCYGLIRKQLVVDSLTGLLVETLLLSPLALIWLGGLYMQGDAAFLMIGTRTDLLLVGAGVLTIVPFTLFAVGVRRLRLGTIGVMQYLTPTLHFLTGVFVLGERFIPADVMTFSCIWGWRSTRSICCACAIAARRWLERHRRREIESRVIRGSRC